MKKRVTYRVELRCDHPEWWRFNVVMTAQGLDEPESPSAYFAISDTIAPVDGEEHFKPADYPAERCSCLECGPCHEFEFYLYILPHSLPDENDVDNTPSFEAELTILSGRSRLYQRQVEVNRWGGATLRLRWPEPQRHD